MAIRYMDVNGATAGFTNVGQTLTNSWNNLFTASGLPRTTLRADGLNTSDYNVVSADSLSFGSSSVATTFPGTLTIITGITRSINAIETINLNGGTQVIAGATGTSFFSLITGNAGAPYVDVKANSNLTISAITVGTTPWEKRGINKLTLTGVNTFSGGMTISAGTVEVGNTSALGTGTVTMTGGKLSSSSTTPYFVSNAFSVSGNISFLDGTNTGFIATSGAFNIAAPTTVTLNAAQQLYVSGALNSTNSAATLALDAVSGSSYRFVGPQGTFNSQITLNLNAVVLLAEYTSGTPNQFNGASSVTLNSGSRLMYFGSTGTTVPYSISGAGIFTVVNPQTTTFSNTVSQSGPFEIFAGNSFLVNQAQKVVFSNAASFGTAQYYALYSDFGSTYTNLTQTIEYTGAETATNDKIIFIDHASNNGGTFIYRNNSSSTLNHTGQIRHNKPTIAETFDINAANGPMTFSSTGVALYEFSTGVLSVKKTGTYAASINGTGNYRGTLQVLEGTLNANNALALGSDISSVSVTSGATLSLGAAPTYSTRSLTVSWTGSASAPNNGALIIANAGTNTFGGITLGATGTYIRATNSGIIDAPFTPNNNSIIFGASAGSDFIPFASLSNVFSGTGAVTYGGHSLDTGIVRADVRHTYTGNTTLAFGTTYVDSTLELPATGGPLGNKSLTAANTLLMTGGTLSYLHGSTDYSGRFSTAGGQQWKIDAAGQTVTYATALVGASSLSLSDTSTGGSLTLSSSASTFSGGVNLLGGSAILAAAELTTGLGVSISGPLGLTGTITFTGGTLTYSTSNQFDYSFRFATSDGQNRKIDTNGQSVTFASSLGGINSLALVGSAGALTLAVANTYTQGTTLSVGTLKCGNVASLGTGGLAQGYSTTLHVATVDGKMTITGAHTNTGTGSRTIRIGAA